VTGSTTKLKLTSVLSVPAGLDVREILKERDYLAIVPPTGFPVLAESEGTAADLTEIAIKSFPGGSLPAGVTDLPVGSIVYNVRNARLRTFRVMEDDDPDTNDVFLVVDSEDATVVREGITGDILAEGIEDLQMAYCPKDQDPAVRGNYLNVTPGLDTLNKTPIKAIRINLISRTFKPDPYGAKFPRIQAENHTNLGPPDAYPRRSLETVVQLRNY
jgi:hypothetical protein